MCALLALAEVSALGSYALLLRGPQCKYAIKEKRVLYDLKLPHDPSPPFGVSTPRSVGQATTVGLGFRGKP